MSTAVGVRFCGGRYHATPWNRHVNEAEVEWPPSPLRLLRALVAVWHRKVDRSSYSEDVLQGLVEALATKAPSYRLPSAKMAHTRHYMPIRSGRSEKSTLVFDAFLRIDPDDELIVIWPDLELSVESRDLLTHLVERLGYLGRAESWTECRVLDDWSVLPDCGPEVSAHRWGGEHLDLEAVDVPAALPPDVYASWRTEQVKRLGIEKPRLKRDKQLAATLPASLVDALRLDTGDARDLGWSRLPGTTQISYLRPRDCFTPSPKARLLRRVERPLATTARLALLRTTGSRNRSSGHAPPLPLMEDAVRIGEAMRKAAIRHADTGGQTSGDGEDRIPPVLSGHDMPEGEPHQHAFYLPEDLDGDGRIDHITVHARAGFDASAVRALGRIPRLWISGDAEWGTLLETHGAIEDFDGHPYLAPARVWTSVTPYLHPWFRKRSLTIEDQILRELRERGMPEPSLERLETIRLHERERRPVHFHRFRSRRGLTQPDTQGSFWRLTFAEPVSGPIALGFGCHYGLGLFASTGDW